MTKIAEHSGQVVQSSYVVILWVVHALIRLGVVAREG